MNPEISIIIVTHNRPQGLLKAIDSVFKQTFQNFELIVLDNGSSTDSYKKIDLEVFNSDRFRYLYFEDNAKVGKRLNQGISLSRGDYITFLTDDSDWCPEALDHLIDGISSGLDLVCAKNKTLDFNTQRYIPNNFGNYTWKEGEIKFHNPIHITSVILKRDLIDRVGGFNEDYIRAYDLDLWNRIHSNKMYITGKLDDPLSEVIVNNPDGLSEKTKNDFKIESLDNPNRMKDYFTQRKSVSINLDEENFINNFNENKLNWVAVSNKYDTDCLVTRSYLNDLENYEGKLFYYIDHPSLLDKVILEKCDGIISPFEISQEKPKLTIRKGLDKKVIREFDRKNEVKFSNNTIVCLNLDDSNIDFFSILLNHLVLNFGNINIITENNEYLEEINNSIEGVNIIGLNKVDLNYLAEFDIGCILSLNSDYNNYLESYGDFIFSSVLKVPLITSDNIGFKNLKDIKNSLIICESIEDYCNAFKSIKNSDLRKKIVKNARYNLYINFINEVNNSKISLFMDEFMENKNIDIDGENCIFDVNSGNKSLSLFEGLKLKQYINLDYEYVNGISVYVKPNQNHDGILKLLVSNGDNNVIFEVPNYKVKEGWNYFCFDNLFNTGNNDLIFYLNSDVDFFEVFYQEEKNITSVLQINSMAKKAHLKHRIYGKIKKNN